MSEWITINAAASYVKVGRSTLYRLARSGVVPAHKIGRSWRFSLPELDDWIRSEPENVSRDLNGLLRSHSDSVHSQPMRIIDLFCGAGGLTLGFTRLAFQPAVSVWANDFNRYAAETYNANFGTHCINGDIIDLLADSKTGIPQADIVIGGPPCQGFSLLNKNRDGDPRKQLWHPYMEVVRRCGAEIFVMENVPQQIQSV
jgi:DNA (cytosine-5)-methyltransferase 1